MELLIFRVHPPDASVVSDLRTFAWKKKRPMLVQGGAGGGGYLFLRHLELEAVQAGAPEQLIEGPAGDSHLDVGLE